MSRNDNKNKSLLNLQMDTFLGHPDPLKIINGKLKIIKISEWPISWSLAVSLDFTGCDKH